MGEEGDVIGGLLSRAVTVLSSDTRDLREGKGGGGGDEEEDRMSLELPPLLALSITESSADAFLWFLLFFCGMEGGVGECAEFLTLMLLTHRLSKQSS